MDIRDQIKAEIIEQEANLHKLRIALEVVESFIGWKPAAKALAAPKADQPLFTVKRTGQPPATTKTHRMKRPGEFQEIMKQVAATLATHGGSMRSGEVIDVRGAKGNKQMSDDIYRSLSALKAQGVVSRSDDGLYHLIEQDQGEAINGDAHAGQPSSEADSVPPNDGDSAEAA